MKKIVGIPVVLMFIVVVLVAAAEQVKHKQCGDMGLLLKISTSKITYEIAEAIPLSFIIVNTNNHKMLLPTAFGNANTAETPPCISSGMFIVCQSQKGQHLNFKGGYFKASGPGILLRPGQQFSASTTDLTKFFDLKPGTYDIQLLFTKRYSGFIDAASNRITITVKGKSGGS